MLLGAASGLLVAGCGGQDKPESAEGATSRPGGVSASGADSGRLPSYEIDPALQGQYPDVVAFVTEFLETCYAGDYEAYRLLVARATTPESPQRFEAIYRAIERVRVESIEPVEVPGVEGTAYLVVSDVRLDPQRKVSIRGAHRKLAILVFQELGQWRMTPAPSHLQPRDPADGAPAASSAPAGENLFFPWELEEPPSSAPSP